MPLRIALKIDYSPTLFSHPIYCILDLMLTTLSQAYRMVGNNNLFGGTSSLSIIIGAHQFWSIGRLFSCGYGVRSFKLIQKNNPLLSTIHIGEQLRKIYRAFMTPLFGKEGSIKHVTYWTSSHPGATQQQPLANIIVGWAGGILS
jgi:hypothetical protein